ncbi:hypothetical protein [Gordonia sp. FQ]|uniref:hypothetical protein n=1 Tax=Gordonia sp. FQ TaxID=3446634 RepID=UPI003F837FBD
MVVVKNRIAASIGAAVLAIALAGCGTSGTAKVAEEPLSGTTSQGAAESAAARDQNEVAVPMDRDTHVVAGAVVQGCGDSTTADDAIAVRVFNPATGQFDPVSAPSPASGDATYTSVTCAAGGTKGHPVLVFQGSNSTPGSGIDSEKHHCMITVVSIPDGKVAASRDVQPDLDPQGDGKCGGLNVYGTVLTVRDAAPVYSLADLHPVRTQVRDEFVYTMADVIASAPGSDMLIGRSGLFNVATGKLVLKSDEMIDRVKGQELFVAFAPCGESGTCADASIIDAAGRTVVKNALVPLIDTEKQIYASDKLLVSYVTPGTSVGGHPPIPAAFNSYDLTDGKTLIHKADADAENLGISFIKVDGDDMYVFKSSAATGNSRVVINGRTGATVTESFEAVPEAHLDQGWTLLYYPDRTTGHWSCGEVNYGSFERGCSLTLSKG